MKRFVSLAMSVLASISVANACDVCGCSASNQYLGILPQATYNFIGLQYQYNSFKSSHPSLFENKPDEKSEDYYNTFQIWGRYNLGKRIQLFGFLPYRHNLQFQDSVRTVSSGIGDVSVLANVIIIKEKDEALLQQQLLAGAGLKMPTGKYTGITAMDKQGLPNMQAGSGSWDFVLNANYTLRKKTVGLNLDAAYTVTLPNRDNYKYGNRLNAGIMGFKTFKMTDFTFIPQAGLRYEFSLHDYDDYSRKWLNEQSGGYMAFAALGVQGYYKKLGARITYSIPIGQYYGNGYVTARQKIDAGIFVLF
jgi:hypothetical protein